MAGVANISASRTIGLAAVMLASVIVCLLIGIDIVSYRTVPPTRMRIEGDPLVSPDPEIGYVPRPRSRSRRIDRGPDGRILVDYHVYTDRLGARVSRAGEETPDRVDLLMVGDSFAWGHGVENQDTFAAQVFHRLHATGANLALGSYGTTQALQMLARNRTLRPRLVIYPFISDHLQRNVDPCARSYYPFCLEYSHVAWREGRRPEIVPPRRDGTARLQLQVKAEREGLDPLTWFIHGIDVAVSRVTFLRSRRLASDVTRQEAALEYLLDHMARAADALGSTLLVVYIPSGPPIAPPPGVVSRTAAGVGFRFLDLSESFRRYHETPRAAPLYIPNDGHPSVVGHTLIADGIEAFVVRERLIAR